jgi:hypothetical protein
MAPPVTATHDATIRITQGSRSTTVRLFDYLTPEAAEDAERAANAWIKSLRHVRFEGAPFREAFSYRGDSLWWFAELYLHKQRTINRAIAAIRALEALIERERPDAIASATADAIVRAVVPQLAIRHRLAMGSEAPATGDEWLARAGSSIVPRVYAFSPVLKRIRTALQQRSEPSRASTDVVVFVHSAFWRAETAEDTYVGPLVEALRTRFGERLQIVTLGPQTSFRTRTWRRRLQELWARERARDVSSSAPPSIEAFSSIAALAGSRRVWKERGAMSARLIANEGLRRASIVEGVDLWDLLKEDFSGIATLQAPWSARAMDEAAAALDALRPRVIVTYAEAGGWGRALVLEARRRRIASVGLQHGFISRHWLNYLHEPDETEPLAAPGADSGFPFPTTTLLYDEVAREQLERHGRFPSHALQIIGNPRLEVLASVAARLTPEDRARALEAAGARSGQSLVLLAIKYRPAWNATLGALIDAIARMPHVHLAIRPHPADAPASYEALVGNAPNVRIVPRTVEAVALITAARLVVTINSTVAIEAMALGTPALAMRLPNYLSPFVDAGAMAGTRTVEEIGPTVAQLVVDGDARAALLERARRFTERYRLMPDGRAAERTIDIVEALSRRGQ